MILLALACAPPTADPPPLTPGAPLAGAAERLVDLPMGSPMGGYSARCSYLGGASDPGDLRDSAYVQAWAVSAGLQTRPRVKAFWLENGEDRLVVLKLDAIYSFDGFVTELERRLEADTGQRMHGRVVVAASHTHAMPANFSAQYHFYLGGDRYNQEIFERYVEAMEEVALAAREAAEPAAIGVSWWKDWDPDDLVYHDRRGENDDLAVWDDLPPGYGKDPWLNVVRADALDGRPIAALFTFGIHGTSLGEENAMWSIDAPGHIELAVEEALDPAPVVIHLQGGGGDASPGGVDSDYARLESVGELARPLLVEAWEQTPTSDAPIRMESATRHIPQGLDSIHVTRGGTVDWYYPPAEDGRLADEIVYDEEGNIVSPLDEFNAPYGAAFCGADIPLIPGWDIGSSTWPYSSCVDVDAISRVLPGIFGLEAGSIPLPLPESEAAGTLATRLGPLLVRDETGEVHEEDLLAAFIPAEPTAMYTEQFRRRARDELGYRQALPVGYAQDHEGYFLIPEDWLRGGYEPNINVWGPLQAEHVMEGILAYSETILGTDVREPDDLVVPFAPPTTYATEPLPAWPRDPTPEAGTRLVAPPVEPWTPLDIPVDLDIPQEVPRVQGVVQLAWQGGDPAVDLPTVTVERLVDGTWEPLRTPSGRAVTDALPDVLLTWTPDPPGDQEDPQDHIWWAAWQAVGHADARPGLPAGTYRLHVEGRRWVASESWPFETEPYELTSPEFELVPAVLEAWATEGGLGVDLPAPAEGWRLLDLQGASRGTNPVRGEVVVTFTLADGSSQQVVAEASPQDGWSLVPVDVPADATGFVVEDAWGNKGEGLLP